MTRLISEYTTKLTALLQEIAKDEEENILKAADLLSDKVLEGRLINIFGAGGHSAIAAMEIFWRAGGLACVNGMFPVGTNVMTAGPTTAKLPGYARYILNFYEVDKDDVLILVNFYGLNITAVDVALEAKERGVNLRREVNCLDMFRARMMNGRLHTFIRNSPFLKRLAKKFFK